MPYVRLAMRACPTVAPHLEVRDWGLSASFHHDAIKFSPHDPNYESNSVIVDLKNGTVAVEWTGIPSLQLKLKSLKCYQLPGTAVKVLSKG